MPLSDDNTRAEIEQLRHRAALARERASMAAARADRHLGAALSAGSPPREWHEQRQSLLRGVQQRHLMAARMHEMLAARLEIWLDRDKKSALPALMEAIAAQLGAASAVATLRTQQRALALVAASGQTARAAHDLELVMAEGPATDAADGVVVKAGGTTLLDRWPRYGPAVAELGIRAVCAAPLGPAGAGIGALCAYDTVSQAPERIATATKLMADILTQLLLGASEGRKPEADLAILGFLDAADNQAVVQQAVGMVSVQFGCGLKDAADLLAARAFADSAPLPEVAQQVVRGEVQLS